MRLATLFCSLLVLAGFTAAQDTNFSVGPQYLMTSGSPLFAQPIATPSLSLSTPPASLSAAATEATSEPSSSSAGLPSQPDLTRIYWGKPDVAENAGGNASENASQNVSEIEITSAQPTSPMPASILDSGVTGMTTVQALRQRGYGVPLGDTAAFWKSHRPHAIRVYTNADVQRLHAS
jgi:hypothetical protein